MSLTSMHIALNPVKKITFINNSGISSEGKLYYNETEKKNSSMNRANMKEK